MDKAYYDEYKYLERNHWWFKVRKLILEQYIKHIIYNNKKLIILNIGSATGATSEFLNNFGEVRSIEYDKDCSIFSSKNLNLSVLNASITSLPFKSSKFDLVCAFDVIEHVENDKEAVEEMHRVCKQNGNILITVPAYQFLWSEHDNVNQHFRRYNKNKLKTLMNSILGNKIIYTSYFNSILFPFISFFRLISNIIPKDIYRKGAGSDFTIVNMDSFVNKVLYILFSFEIIYLKYLKFPFGVSLMIHSKKD